MKKDNAPSLEQLEELCQRYFSSMEHRFHGIVLPKNAPLGINACEKSAYDELMAMTGLEDVKLEINRQLAYHKIMELRKKEGYRVPKRLLHLLLAGNSGTGKTTCARLIGRIYKDAGLLSSGHMIETSRAGLVGQYIGQSELLVTEKIQAAKGGVLFIDEIYSLTESIGANTENKDFGYRVLDTLMPVLSDPESNLMVIGAGYTSEMKHFLEANPGLRSRFPVVIEFKDFTLAELLEIAHKHVSMYDFQFSPEADDKLKKILSEAYSVKNVGNARFVTTLIDNHIIPNLCMRFDQCHSSDCHTIDDSSIIIPEDIPSLSKVVPLFLNRKRIGYESVRSLI